MMIGRVNRIVGALVSVLCVAGVNAAPMANAERAGCSKASASAIESHIAALARMPRADVQDAIRRIDGTDRKLLALRSYLRARDSLATRWSWTQSEIDAYLQSDRYRDMVAEIERIKAHFAAANPGYTLYANTDVRSLDLQIQRWNENTTVGTVAQDLYRAACGQLASSRKARASKSRFRDFLARWTPERPAPLAAPGLSLHGRARAIDFQVQKGDEVVAWPDTSTIQSAWIDAGWAGRLKASIAAVSSRFDGPLTMPNEPWHFEYRPAPAGPGRPPAGIP